MSKEIKKGAIIKVVVSGIENYGIFVNVDSNTNGLIHISEISDGFVRNINDYVKVGESIYAKVLEIDDHQLKLSIKNINYRSGEKKPMESPNGFEPLRKELPIWMNDALKALNK